jgi:predicted nucleic-acid-binding protein
MIGIDTNLLVRLFTNDDKKQAKFAAQLIETNPIFISKSVLLETEWVLRYTYDLAADVIYDAFEKLLGLPNITVEDLSCILQTLEWYKKDFDFADALHLASSHTAKKFATLDKAFIKKAKQIHIQLMTIPV